MSTEKTVLKEAMIEFKEIMEAAESNAKNKLASERKNDFNAILENEVKKVKKEKYKIVEAITPTNQDNNNTQPQKEFDMTEFKNEDVKNKFDNADKKDEFSINLEDIEKELQEIEELNTDLNNPEEKQEEGAVDDPIAKINDLAKEIELIVSQIGGAEKAETGIEDTGKTVTNEDNVNNEKYMHKELGGKAGQQGNMKPWDKQVKEPNAIDEDNVNNEKYMHKELGGKAGQQANMKPWDKQVTEPNFIDERAGQQPNMEPWDKQVTEPNSIDEIHSLALNANKRVDAATQPRPEYFEARYNKLRSALKELAESTIKKYKGSLEENKKNIKLINALKKETEETRNLMENYKVALGKFKKQLTEMAIFNANLANTNSLLLNEELVLTNEDKERIIKEFKSVSTLNESMNKYNNLLSEIKTSKKNVIDESIETMVNGKVILPEHEDANNLKTVTESKDKKDKNDTLSKIIKMNEYLERNDKKKQTL